jgi:hypothetical protein
MRASRLLRPGNLLVAAAILVAACVAPDRTTGMRHRWWSGLGPVIPHDTFPSDCKLCHVGDGWNTMTDDFHFDHEKETGVPLYGAHQEAKCLRCHNDRGPVAVFTARGCAGCHEDVHNGDLGVNCTECHSEETWVPKDQVAMHNRTRFPLVGTHVVVACHRCHPGAFVGNFVPTDTECVTCHYDKLRVANNPPHIALGYTDHCDRCHVPTSWHEAEN